MRVWLLNYDKFVALNNIQKVSNSIMFDSKNVPTGDGLFSTEIFGTSISERRYNFAYIDLKIKFISPKAYITLTRIERNIIPLISGIKKFRVENGKLIPDEEGHTGLRWLYSIWDELKFEKNESSIRTERIDLLESNKKDVIFTDKFLILPAFYRDVNLQSSEEDNQSVPEINDIYAKIIRNIQAIENANNMDFIEHALIGKTQNLIVDIYNLIKEKIQGKNGYIRRFLMGKTNDYSARVVITATPYVSNSPKEQLISFRYTGLPIAQACATFTPFIVYWLKRWFKNNLENQKDQFQIYDKKEKKYILVKLNNPEIFYNEDYLLKRIDKFVHNPLTRFDRIVAPITEEELKKIKMKGPIYLKFSGRLYNKESLSTVEKDKDNIVTRDLTWTDLMFMACEDVLKDKHIWTTRYPMLDYFGSYPNRISVISTRETIPMVINNTLYKNYPKIDLSIKISDLDSVFRDTVNIPSVFLAAMDADHDGDQTTIKGSFSKEANEECEALINSKANILSIQGNSVRTISNEAIQTLYSLTKFA